jgi:hypothetical protein
MIAPAACADGIDYSDDDILSDEEEVTETEVQLRPRKTLAGEVWTMSFVLYSQYMPTLHHQFDCCGSIRLPCPYRYDDWLRGYGGATHEGVSSLVPKT